jgi:pyruvate dehydrogenase E1 component alpha subunit
LTQTNGQIAAAIEAAETPDTDTRLALYRLMQDCRMLEQRAYDLFMQNLIKGTSHLALGQEAVAAGLTIRSVPTGDTTTPWFAAYR